MRNGSPTSENCSQLLPHVKIQSVPVCIIAGTRDESYQTFLGDIMACGPEDCRYGLFDFEYRHQCEGTNEKSKKEKLLLMTWCPDTAKIKKKMLYSSSFDALKKCLVGSITYIQV